MRNLIRCPYCVEYKKTIGEIMPNGMVAIQRHRGGYINPNSGQWIDGDYTVVSGDFTLTCGNCGKEVYESINVRPIGFHRFTLIETVIRLGTPSYSDYPGSVV